MILENAITKTAKHRTSALFFILSTLKKSLLLHLSEMKSCPGKTQYKIASAFYFALELRRVVFSQTEACNLLTY